MTSQKSNNIIYIVYVHVVYTHPWCDIHRKKDPTEKHQQPNRLKKQIMKSCLVSLHSSIAINRWRHWRSIQTWRQQYRMQHRNLQFPRSWRSRCCLQRETFQSAKIGRKLEMCWRHNGGKEVSSETYRPPDHGSTGQEEVVDVVFCFQYRLHRKKIWKEFRRN